tara:strand:+ start:177 stop:512 length:336 start_codon:yes stop_codon:yes gene_type:complete
MDKKQWDDNRDRIEGRAKDTPHDVAIKQMANVLNGKLLSDEHWHKFQEEAAKHILQAQSAISSFQSVLLDPTTVDADTLARAKIGFHAHQMKLDCFQMMLEFPNRNKNVDD